MSAPSESAYSKDVCLVLMTTSPGEEAVLPPPEDAPLYRIPWEVVAPPLTTQTQVLEVNFPLPARLHYLHVLKGVDPDAKVNSITCSGNIYSPAHLTHLGKPIATSFVDPIRHNSFCFRLEKKHVKVGDLPLVRLVLPKDTSDLSPPFSVTYHLEHGQTFYRELGLWSTVPLTFNGQVLAIRVEGLPPVKHRCIVDVLGYEHAVMVDLRGKDNPVWVLRFQDTQGVTTGASTLVKGEGFNFSRLISPRIIFDPAYTDRPYTIKLTALSVNQFVETGPFDFHTNFRFTL